MEDVLSKDFVEKLTNYIQGSINYSKNYQNLDVSIMDDSFIVNFKIILLFTFMCNILSIFSLFFKIIMIIVTAFL